MWIARRGKLTWLKDDEKRAISPGRSRLIASHVPFLGGDAASSAAVVIPSESALRLTHRRVLELSRLHFKRVIASAQSCSCLENTAVSALQGPSVFYAVRIQCRAAALNDENSTLWDR